MNEPEKILNEMEVLLVKSHRKVKSHLELFQVQLGQMLFELS